MENLDLARDYVKSGNFEAIDLAYGDAQDVLSQLVRTAIIAKDGYTLVAADYSAIEARVISWLSMEQWRLDVFHGDGKIYEATGARMFGVPKESIKKGSELRDKAKISELALGYGGSLGALKNMGGEKMGLSDPEMMSLVRKWRTANPQIVKVWEDMENAAMTAIVTRREELATPQNLAFRFNPSDKCLYMKLPSGRWLCYQNARIGINDKGKEGLLYDGVNQVTRQWGATSTFGGKLTENAVQAMSRDLLADLMYRLTKLGYGIVAHIHDEVIVEVPKDTASDDLARIIDLMRVAPDWCKGVLPLNADGYVTPYYKKD
jgi:DNA polymerase